MAEFKRCEECRVPETFANERQWLNSGVVVQRGNPRQRTGFIEGDNLAPLYAGIEEIIGMPVDRLILESTRVAGGRYVRGLLPPGVEGMLRDGSLLLEGLISVLVHTAMVAGYGKCEVLELDIDPIGADGLILYPGDYITIRVSEPFSIAPIAGIFAGSCEVATGSPFVVDYEQVSPGVYEVRSTLGEYFDAYEERFESREYRHREGTVELEPCPTCGVPKELSAFTWHDDRGVILDSRSGRRMVGIGPYMTDPLFEELEKELGDIVPRAVVEAQRRFIKTGFYSVGEIMDEEGFRVRLALRGMGNLRQMRMAPDELWMRIDNSDCYLMTVGMVQALFEMAYEVESWVEWQRTAEGDLYINVTPKL